MPRVPRRTLVALVGMLTVLGGLVGPAASAPDERPSPPRETGWYLALGDSLAAGYQLDGAEPTEGYVQHVLPALREGGTKTRAVNLGCGGESSDTMVEGGICAYEEGTQLDQAVQFLHAHARFTRLVTLTVGGNNVQRCVSRTTGQIDLACIQAGLQRLSQDLPQILSSLRAVAPDVEIVVTSYYNPFLALWFQGPAGQAIAAQSTVLLQQLNAIITDAAAAYDAEVADVATAFRSLDTTLVGGVPVNVATICRLTLMCTAFDIHASDAGYAVMGEEIVAALD